MKSNFLLLACLAVVFAGCIQDRYEIELTPKGDKVRRELTYSSSGETVNQIELRRLERVYDSKSKKVKNARWFSKEYDQQMPDDVGGHGIYKHWKSPMGTLTVYTERFRGSIDYASQLELRRSAVDDLVDLVVEWMKSEMGGHAEFAKIERFLKTEFRNDLHNLSIGIWQTGFETDVSQPEFFFRVGQFLIERNYFEIDQVPVLVRSLKEGTELPPVVLESIRDRLVRKFELAKTGVEATEFLASHNQAAASFNKHILSSKLANDVLCPKWSKRLGSNITKGKLGSGLTGAALWPSTLQFLSPTAVNVKFHSKVEPIFSNGSWDRNTSSIEWSQSTGERDADIATLGMSEIPRFVFSVSAEPDLDYQKSHLGDEVLSGNELAIYVLWYNALTKDEQAKLDKFIGGFDGSTRILRELNNFKRKAGADFEVQGIEQLIKAVEENKD